MTKIGIIDYGVGNVSSLSRSFKSIGFRTSISADKTQLNQTDVLVLPGVGSFPYAMEKLRQSKLDDFLIDASKKNRPIIGICLGMQLLTDCSQENGNHAGLGLIPGDIRALKNAGFHIGWNDVSVCNDSKFIKKFDKHEFFFNHGYAYFGDEDNILSKTVFRETSFASSIMKGSTLGFQFHPEKSQKAGLQLLKSTVSFLRQKK